MTTASTTPPSLIELAAESAGITTAEMTQVAEGLRSALVATALTGESVAIPRFGTFAAVKEEEQVSRDLSTGSNVLLPPRLELRFTPAMSLRHIITDR